jgi:uncharacterized RDD family membrane protein YckC
MKDTIVHFIEKIDSLLPYPTFKKEEVLEELRLDLEATMKDSDEKIPSVVFGTPRDVAKNLSLSQDWETERAGWGRRIAAFGIDATIQFTIIVIYFLAGFFFLLSRFMSSEEINQLLKEAFIEGGASFNPGFTVFEFIIFFGFLLFLTASSGLFLVCYSVVLERYFSTTIGKKIFGLLVVDESGIRISWQQAIIRNLTKIFVGTEFLLFDALIGLILEKQDPEKARKQRGLDILAETIVVKQN